jgi:membrane protein
MFNIPAIIQRPCKFFIQKSVNFLLEVWSILRLIQLPYLIKTVLKRMQSKRITQAASSLSFTTLLALVPLVTVALSLFVAVPSADNLQAALENYFIENLMPKPVANTVTKYLTLFSDKARGLSIMGFLFLCGSAISLFASIERTLNDLWQAPTPKLLNHRWLIYWAAVLFAPFLIGISFYLVVELFSNLRGFSRVFGKASPTGLHALAVFLATAMWASIFKIIPNTTVRWSHAWLGAVVSSSLLFLLKYLFVTYLLKLGNFKQLYGAFSVVPVFLLWVYGSWLATLFGATVSACLPTIKANTLK